MPSSHLILCCPLLLLPSIPPRIRVFSNESTLRMRWPKDWSFSFSITPSKEHPGLISFRMDWLDLLAVQGALKSLLQHHSSKASILWHSAFFTVQLSHTYMTTGKTIALTRRTLVGKVMSLLLNMLSRLVITFLPRSKHLLSSWLQSPSAVILEPQKIKSDTVSTVSPSISHIQFSTVQMWDTDSQCFVTDGWGGSAVSSGPLTPYQCRWGISSDWGFPLRDPSWHQGTSCTFSPSLLSTSWCQFSVGPIDSRVGMWSRVIMRLTSQ